MNPRPGDDESRPRPGSGRRRVGFASRRVLAVSFGISVALHLVLLGLYQAVRPDAPPPATPFGSEPVPLDALEVLLIAEALAAQDPERPDDPNQPEDLEVPEVATDAPELEGVPAPDLPPPPPGAAERLRPRLTVPELWRPIDPSLRDLSLEQREEGLLAGRIAEWYDSLAAADELERRLTDWTYTDDEGRRWGVADGRIYLGDIVLPGQHFFAVPTGKRDEYNQLLWQWNQIELQKARAAVLESWRERQEAIRERRDRERTARPDTARARR